MALRDLLIAIAEGWPAYRALHTTRKDHPEYELVVRSLPRELDRRTSSMGSPLRNPLGQHLRPKPSAGPWARPESF